MLHTELNHRTELSSSSYITNVRIQQGTNSNASLIGFHIESDVHH